MARILLNTCFVTHSYQHFKFPLNMGKRDSNRRAHGRHCCCPSAALAYLQVRAQDIASLDRQLLRIRLLMAPFALFIILNPLALEMDI